MGSANEKRSAEFRTNFRDLLDRTRGGKRISTDLYLHLSHPEAEPIVSAVKEWAEVPAGATVLKASVKGDWPSVSFLSYQEFFDDPFPSLIWSEHHSLQTGAVTLRRESGNPPILHRKELLLAEDHPRRREYEALTNDLLAYGVLPARQFIGRQIHWQNYLCKMGYRVLHGRIVRMDVT
jgi:hypothetical protein